MKNELAILTWMANPADVRVISRLLQKSELALRACGDVDSLLAEARQGGGVLLLEEENLSDSAMASLNVFLDQQPPWSELPVVLLVRKLSGQRGPKKFWPQLIRNLTLLERPVSSASLLSVLQAALQSRQRQYEVRDLLADLEKSKKELEERVRERTAELESSNKELEQFAHIISHDLREPLRTISGFLDLLKRRYRGKMDHKADEFIDFAVDGSKRLDRMINDLLEYSRVQQQEMELQPVDLFEVWLETVEQLHQLLERSGAHISHDPLPKVRGNSPQLSRLFQNLITNAIRYRRPEVAPRVHFAAKEKETAWELQVRDNGIGIRPKHQRRIFQLFQRLHSQEEYPGTGVGLAICRKVVELHGGRIWVESEPGQGSIFHFTLPKA